VDAASAASLLRLVEEARGRSRASGDASPLDDVGARYPALLEAMDWFLEQSRTDEAYRLASALVPFWLATKRIDDGDRWFTAALDKPGASELRGARALYDHGYLVFWAGQYDVASERFADARARARAVGDADLEALALAGSARVELTRNVQGAILLLREAIDATATVPDSPGRSSAMHVLGVALQMSGDLHGAREVMDARLKHGRELGDRSIVYIESANLSMVERRLGNFARAEALSRDALRIVWDRRDQMAIPWVINGLAAVTAAKSQPERAAILLGIAENLLARAGGEWPPDEREQHDGTFAQLAKALRPDALERHRGTGAAMGLQAGVAFALADDAGGGEAT